MSAPTPPKPGRKPRQEAVLKNLPPARQASLFTYMEGEGEEKGHSYRECIAWLAADEIRVDKEQLRKWREWYYLRLGFQQSRDDARTLLESEAAEGETIPEEKIQRIGNQLFSMRAIKEQNVKAWFLTQSLNLEKAKLAEKTGTNKKKLELIERRLVLLEEREAKTKAVVADTTLTPEEKEERYKEILGMKT